MSSPSLPDGVQLATIEARTAGRYFVRKPTDGCDLLVFGFHGYGENAESHLGHLMAISSLADSHLVSIQGLNRFYVRQTGAVVAHWMTSEDRDQMIASNLDYVGSIVQKIEAERAGAGHDSASSTRLWIGFSQGVAMAYRAAARFGRSADGLISLGGDVPPELGGADWQNFPRVLVGRGLDDAWYDSTKFGQDVERLRGAGVSCDSTEFAGGHEWNDAFRAECDHFVTALGS